MEMGPSPSLPASSMDEDVARVASLSYRRQSAKLLYYCRVRSLDPAIISGLPLTHMEPAMVGKSRHCPLSIVLSWIQFQ